MPVYSERHGAQNVKIMERHLQAFVKVFVMHEMDAVHRMDVGAGEPFHSYVELGHHVVEIEEFAGDWKCLWRDLFAGLHVTSAVDRVEQCFRQIDAGAEELHLFSESHC